MAVRFGRRYLSIMDEGLRAFGSGELTRETMQIGLVVVSPFMKEYSNYCISEMSWTRTLLSVYMWYVFDWIQHKI